MNMELRRARNRQMVIFLLVCAGMLILSGRLYYWQVIDGPHLSAYANDEHTQSQTLSAPRGRIYDSHGLLLATNIIRDDVYVDPVQLVSDNSLTYDTERSSLAQKLHQILPDISEAKLKNYLSSKSYAVRVAVSITPEQSQKLRQMHLPYTFLEPRTWRDYPSGDLAAQVLGFVQDGSDGSSRGVYGIEREFNKVLAGKAGSLTAETDLNGNPLTVGASSTQPVVNGADLALTIDGTMQYMLQTELAKTVSSLNADSGTALVVNARTGAIVAMAGAPSFDPNNYSQYANQKGCVGQLEVYSNPTLYCTYEPGSIMKAITMAAGIDQHVITPDDTIYDPGYLEFKDGTQRVTNWAYKGYNTESMTQVLEHSANVGSAWVAYYKLGADRFYPYLQKFGFGQPTGLYPSEPSGFYRTPRSPDWSKSDLARQSFGQSIEASPLQMAMAYQALANDGVLMKPYIVSSINDHQHVTTIQPQVQRQVVSPETAKTVTQMLEKAAAYNGNSVPGYSVAIKTGTATTQGLADTETEASMAGYLPASNPQFVILVKIDRPKMNIFGAGAGSLWRLIAQQLMWRYGVPPDQQ